MTRLALAGSFCAITDLHSEGPNGSFRAFADDPKTREEYFRALAYDVASAAGLASQNATPFAGREDPKVQRALREYGGRLTPEDRDAAINAGERIAQHWRPLLTPQERVSGLLPAATEISTKEEWRY